jgi:hypothetical protein
MFHVTIYLRERIETGMGSEIAEKPFSTKVSSRFILRWKFSPEIEFENLLTDLCAPSHTPEFFFATAFWIQFTVTGIRKAGQY